MSPLNFYSVRTENLFGKMNCPIQAGIPQGSVFYYIIYTEMWSNMNHRLSHEQKKTNGQLDWIIKINGIKSIHVTFTLRTAAFFEWKYHTISGVSKVPRTAPRR